MKRHSPLSVVPALLAASVSWGQAADPAPAPVRARTVAGAPQAAESVQALLQQARFLMGKRRPDLARLIVQKALAVDSQDPAAVLMAADLQLQAGQTEEARTLLAQLERTQPQAPQTRELQSLMRVYTVDRLRLQQLRKLAEDGGRDDEAKLLARQLFPEGRPPGLLSDQYGWLLAPSAGRNNRPSAPTDPAVVARRRGYDALAARAHDRAETEFKAALRRRPDDASSLGGMGIVRLRDSRYAEAERYFEQAIARETVDASEWHDLSRTARYWRLVGEARELIARNETTAAGARLRDALPLQPRQTEAKVLLADLLASQGQTSQADRLYDEVLAIDPREGRALRGRLALRMARADTPAAQRAVIDEAARVGRLINTPAGELIDAGALRAVAQREAEAGRPQAAQALLAEGVRVRPADAWLRYDLARLYQQDGRSREARQVMDEGVARAPADAEMRHAAALVAFSDDDEAAALAHLQAIAQADRTPAHESLAHNAAFEQALRQQRQALARGDAAASDAAIEQARQRTEGRLDRRLRIARAEMGAGRTARAQAELDAIDPAALSADDAATWVDLAADAGRESAAQQALSRLIGPSVGTPQQDRLIALQSRLAERRIDRARQAGRLDEARTIAGSALQPWQVQANVPRSARLAQAELWLAANEPARAVAELDGVKPVGEDIDLRLLRSRALAAAGRRDEARQELAALIAQRPADPQVRLEAARLARAEGDFSGAMAHLQAAASTPASATASTAIPAADASATSGTSASATVRPTPVSDPAVQAAIDAIEARRQPRVETAYSTYGRSGTPGLSELHAREIPVAVYWPVGYQGHVFGRLDRVSLDAGTLPPDATADRFGTVLAGTPPSPPGLAQRAEGHNVGIGWEDDRRRVDIGVTGLGMAVHNVVGGWREILDTPTTDITLDVSRRPQTSSLLAYAGAVNPGPGGGTWGGVTNTSAALRMARPLNERYAIATTLRLGVMDGRHVQRNPYWQWRTVVDRDWLQTDSWRLNAGVAVMLWQFQHNAGEYTWGHGGYYSPQRYASVSLPVDWTGRRGAWSYQLRGALTHSWTSTASAPYYPLDSALQGNPTLGNPTYGGGRGGGFGTSLRGLMEWQLAPRWVAGAALDLERSSDYAPNRATIYLRHYFKPQGDALSVPPRPVVPYSQF